MVNAKRFKIETENKIKKIGDGNLAEGYGKLGLSNNFCRCGNEVKKCVEANQKIDAYNALSAPKEEPEEEEESKTFTEEELEDKTFKELKSIGNAMGTTGRGKQELIDEILEIQENEDE